LAVLALPTPGQEEPEPVRGENEEFVNLQVLSPEMPHRELIEIMKGYTRALGVRCEYCHVGEPGGVLATFDFASDAKRDKEKTRLMIRMTRDINQRYLTELGPKALEVTCETCHRGQAHPRTLENALERVLARKGLDAAVEEYRRLREESYGSGSFDFREKTLNRLARDLARRDENAAALRFLELNLEHHPDSSTAHFLSGEIHRSQGEVEKARASYRRALELDPENASAALRLEELQER
jgi:tetratricopeptide (TPR) repeat protein